MLIEKIGRVDFTVKSGKRIWKVSSSIYLTALQERQMSRQADMILEFAHFLKTKFNEPHLEIYVDEYVTFNGRENTRYIDNNVNLLSIPENFTDKKWILPL